MKGSFSHRLKLPGGFGIMLVVILLRRYFMSFHGKRLVRFLCMLCLIAYCPFVSAADFWFEDTRFQNDFTTENLNAIIDEYELYDGWYWTTEAETTQTFHGRPDCPGWTTSAAAQKHPKYLKNWYGCRWPTDRVIRSNPEKGGYGECFAFAQFIGYLLSGEINPQHNWHFYYSVEASKGLQVGDIVRVEYTKKGKQIQHSAVVYAVNGEEVLFMQVSGSAGNLISIGSFFSDGSISNKPMSLVSDIASLPGLKISRFTDRNKKEDPGQ